MTEEEQFVEWLLAQNPSDEVLDLMLEALEKKEDESLK